MVKDSSFNFELIDFTDFTELTQMAEVIIHRQPRIAKKGSYKVAVKAGESYWW